MTAADDLSGEGPSPNPTPATPSPDGFYEQLRRGMSMALCEAGHPQLAAELVLTPDPDIAGGWLVGVDRGPGTLTRTERTALEKAALLLNPDAEFLAGYTDDGGQLVEYTPAAR